MAEVVYRRDFERTLTIDLVKTLGKQLGFSSSSLNGALPVFRYCSSGSNIKRTVSKSSEALKVRVPSWIWYERE